MRTGKTQKRTIFIMFFFMIIGIAMICYPLLSNWYTEKTKSVIKTEYTQVLEDLTEDILSEARSQAQKYNQRLLNTVTDANDIQAAALEYESVLKVNGIDIIGYIIIPKIDVDLPIYHGVSEQVLAKGAGHLPTSSFPIGGTGTHAVIAAHTGTAGDKLFTDLNLLEIGDTFYLSVLNEKLKYEVDQITTVLPTQVDSLQIEPDQDYVTLVTCTPYAVNTHRLLVRGHRVSYDPEAANDEEEIQLQSDRTVQSTWSEKYIEGILIGVLISIPMIGLIVLAYCILQKCRKKDRNKKSDD